MFELLDHSYQVGKRLRVHLLHCSAAMNLHGIFCSPDLASDLLIEHPRDNHGDHLTFARSQRGEALLQLRCVLLLVAPSPISFQCDTNSIQEILITAWLRKEFDRPSLHGANTHWNVAVTGDKD